MVVPNESRSSGLSVTSTSLYNSQIQYIPRNMHAVCALLCFVVVIHWLIFPYPSGLLHWHCGNLTIAPVPAKQPWWIWINTSCEFIMNDCITTTKQSTTKPRAYFLGYTVYASVNWVINDSGNGLLHDMHQAITRTNAEFENVVCEMPGNLSRLQCVSTKMITVHVIMLSRYMYQSEWTGKIVLTHRETHIDACELALHCISK